MNRPGVEGLRPNDPEQIGSYRLLGRLGEGGMGTVYLALAPTGRPVAVKVVKAEFAIEDGFAARFHAEVENARRVASFCTAQVLDNGDDGNGRPYMVTEYIAGTPLSRQITEHGSLEAGTLHGVALGVAAALAAIHVAGLVHRDLKPANVILSMSGPRVIDFGIARALDSTHSFTRSGEVLGSPGWWAPEQVRGLDITPAADIFAWGCMVAYAGNGRHPYGRGDMMTMASRLLTIPPDLGELPDPLNELVRRATAMDPYQRPSAQDLLIALVGGAIAAPAMPAPTRVDPPTLIATDLLNESWQPPANVEPDSTQTLSGLNLKAPQALSAESPTPAPTPPPYPYTSGLPTTPPASASSSAPHPGSTPTLPPPPASAPTPRPYPASTQPSRSIPPSGQADSPAPLGAGTAPTGERPSRRGWWVAGLAVLAALAVTVVVLVTIGGGGGGGGAVNAGGAGNTGGQQQAGTTDVNRRIATGSYIEDPQLIITQTPRCDLTAYRGNVPSRGRFCTVQWILFNAGGKPALLSRTPLVLTDDRGATHIPEPSSVGLPAALPPGGKVDGVLVYDLPPARKPLKLTGSVIEGGKEITVRLS
ncbi:serine/threonine-protein kinase [Streptosporangium lutulentum]|uniref:Serine/threonine protein kinase n=1 Tax=Streptosporangium lutulentum TaxID=1461250 RepID=A0ABT9QQ50_9ACTN|nr:serine/threonine-protein kinase [Streptosporangium lutulentum]MDP9848882.1 serine/threonine protein kinase [Streptosporangium lutulentum]